MVRTWIFRDVCPENVEVVPEVERVLPGALDHRLTEFLSARFSLEEHQPVKLSGYVAVLP